MNKLISMSIKSVSFIATALLLNQSVVSLASAAITLQNDNRRVTEVGTNTPRTTIRPDTPFSHFNVSGQNSHFSYTPLPPVYNSSTTGVTMNCSGARIPVSCFDDPANFDAPVISTTYTYSIVPEYYNYNFGFLFEPSSPAFRNVFPIGESGTLTQEEYDALDSSIINNVLYQFTPITTTDNQSLPDEMPAGPFEVMPTDVLYMTAVGSGSAFSDYDWYEDSSSFSITFDLDSNTLFSLDGRLWASGDTGYGAWASAEFILSMIGGEEIFSTETNAYSSYEELLSIVELLLAPGSYSLRAFTTNSGPGYASSGYGFTASLAAVPVPAGVWLFTSALLGFAGFKRYRK